MKKSDTLNAEVALGGFPGAAPCKRAGCFSSLQGYDNYSYLLAEKIVSKQQ